MKTLVACLLILFFYSFSYGQEIFSNYIGSLRPLASTDTEVARRLGKASIIGSKHFYKTEYASIEVTYTKECRWSKSGKRLEPNLIRYISFFPIKPLYFDELEIDISAFSKSPTDPDLPSVVAFSNKKTGVAFNLDLNAKPERGGTIGRVTLWLGTERPITCSDG